MQLILKYRAGLSELNETSVEFDGEFEKTIAQLKDINSDIHQRFDEELDEVQILKSKVGIEFDKANNQIISKIIYKLDQEPNQEELNIIIEETAGQLTDGYGEEPWKVKLSKGIVFISLINFSKSEYLNPVEVKLLPGKKISDIFSKLRSILPKKNCTKKLKKLLKTVIWN